MSNNNAVMYLRSSKDRHGVAIDTQRGQMQSFAKQHGYTIVDEYVDECLSGKNENRPGYQALCRDLQAAGRNWDTLLVTDISRLSRNHAATTVLLDLAELHRVDIRLTDYFEVAGHLPKEQLLFLSIFAQQHSESCRRKTLAGMAENVRKKYRSGGRAPRGYRLIEIDTGLWRDGERVIKSRLEIDEQLAPQIQAYLKGRAKGVSRTKLIGELELPYPVNSMVDIEWNALTYAGHTTFNQQYKNEKGYGYRGKNKRRPRKEWLVTENTHPPLITTEEANTILGALEQTPYSPYKYREARSSYLFTGLLTTSEDKHWQGDGASGFYRAPPVEGQKERKLLMPKLDGILLEWVASDIQEHEFMRQLIASYASECVDPELLAMQCQLEALTRQVDINEGKYLTFPSQIMHLQGIQSLCANEWTDAMKSEAQQLKRAIALRTALSQGDVHELKTYLQEWANQLHAMSDRPAVKQFLQEMISKIELDPETLQCNIHYKAGRIVEHRMVGGRRSWRPAA